MVRHQEQKIALYDRSRREDRYSVRLLPPVVVDFDGFDAVDPLEFLSHKIRPVARDDDGPLQPGFRAGLETVLEERSTADSQQGLRELRGLCLAGSESTPPAGGEDYSLRGVGLVHVDSLMTTGIVVTSKSPIAGKIEAS